MQDRNATIYKRYGLWYVCFKDGPAVSPIHVTGPFQTRAQAQQIVRYRALAERLVH
jgi:hypothetical protein